MTGQFGIRVGVNAAIVRDGALLVVEFEDAETGLHYNLPGGGVQAGESLYEALRREVREETCAEIEIGPLLLVWEYVPAQYAERYGPIQKLGLIFGCALCAGSSPRLSERPDAHQIGVRWVPLEAIRAAPPQPRPVPEETPALQAEQAVSHVPLLPQIGEQLIAALRVPSQSDLLIKQI